jgi:hypothetical protein
VDHQALEEEAEAEAEEGLGVVVEDAEVVVVEGWCINWRLRAS